MAMGVGNEGDKKISAEEPALVSLCSKAVNLTNNINTHLSDYAGSPEAQNETIQSFTTRFNRLREILWKIQAGMPRLTQGNVFVPYKASQELSTRMQHVVHDLVSSDLIVVKLISSSRKTGFRKLLAGLKQASLDTDISMLSDTMARHRDALRNDWIAFSENLSKFEQSSALNDASHISSKDGKDGLMVFPKDLAVQPPARAMPAKITSPPLRQIHDDFRLNSPLASHSLGQTGSLQQETFDYAPAQGATSAHSSIQPDEPRTPHSVDQDWGKPNVWPGSKPLRMDNFSRNSSFRLGSVTSMQEHLPTPSAEPQFWSNSGSTAEKAALVAALERQDHKVLQQLLRGMSTGNPIPSGLLSQAVGSNDVSSLRLLLTYGASVNHVDADGNSALLLAVATWSNEMATLLLEHGADPNLCAVESSMSPFTLAAQQNQVELVQLMLDHGANVNAMLSNGDTPINACICQGARTEIVALLLGSGAVPNQKTRDGKTPLFEALSRRRLDIVKLLLDHGASPNLAGPKHPLWPATYLPPALKLLIARGAKPQMASGNMELAASINNIQSIQILLDAGVSPNLKKDGVYTPLCSAIRDDRADIVTLLLSNGADPNLPASEYPAWKCISHGRLHFLPSLLAAGANLHSPSGIAELAVAHNNKDALMYLLLNGVDVNAANDDGRTALTTAIRDDRLQLVDMLLAHGANVTARGENWPLCMALGNPTLLKRLLEHVQHPKSITKGIIELAVQANQLESVKLLVEAGISVEDRTGGVFSPLTSAIRENRKEIVRYLLDEAGADVNSPGEHLPLIKAIRRCTDSNDTEIIELLLERGADINLVYRGWNAIMQAVEKGDKKLIRLLIEKGNGIDLQTLDSDSGQTVYEIISERGWSEGIELLMEHRHQLRMVTDGSMSRN
ncbi:hypothetical protein LTS08_008494 [Lithohypha guttulata]|nr:hypothetical protein LTS08_008494 [Lithohypha guttulata]